MAARPSLCPSGRSLGGLGVWRFGWTVWCSRCKRGQRLAMACMQALQAPCIQSIALGADVWGQPGSICISLSCILQTGCRGSEAGLCTVTQNVDDILTTPEDDISIYAFLPHMSYSPSPPSPLPGPANATREDSHRSARGSHAIQPHNRCACIYDPSLNH